MTPTKEQRETILKKIRKRLFQRSITAPHSINRRGKLSCNVTVTQS